MPRPKKGHSPWVSTCQILEELNITKTHLYRLRQELFIQNKHWRDVSLPSSRRPSYRWHLPNCQKALTRPEVGVARDSDKLPGMPSHEPCP